MTTLCFKYASSGLPFLIQANRNTLKMSSSKTNYYPTCPDSKADNEAHMTNVNHAT